MRGITFGAFAASIVLAAAFFASRLLPPDLLSPDSAFLAPVSWLGEWLLPIAYGLLLIGIVTGTLSRKIDEGAFAIIGGFAAIATLSFSVLQFANEQKRSVDRATLQLLVDIEQQRPPNARFCRCALLGLLESPDRSSFDRMFERAPVPLASLIRAMVDRCFSDLKARDRDDLIAGGGLTSEGASFFAAHLNRILALDDNIAFAIHHGVVRRDTVSEAVIQSIAVAKRIADAYVRRLEFKGFANLQRVRIPNLPANVCRDAGAVAKS